MTNIRISQLLAQAPADLPPYKPTTPAANDLINLLAWGASAAGVFGLIVVGIQLTLQLRRGEMGEGAQSFRGFFIVLVAAVVATAAGPLVQWFGPFDPAVKNPYPPPP